MNGETNSFPVQVSVTLLEEKWDKLVADQLIHQAPVDQAERDYLREKAVNENMTARRLFADDDI